MTTRGVTVRTNEVLGVLFVGAFVMGCAEMLVVGLLDLIAADLQVTVPAAGALVTANALGLAIGGPVLTMLTTRFDRRAVLLGALTVFVLANLLPALVADYQVFLAARVVIGAVQGLFIAAAMTTATSLVPPERAGSAMAIVISGFATASAFGLPVGTLLGQAVGWRGSFVAVVVVGLIVLVTAVGVLPSVPTARESRAAGPGAARVRPTGAGGAGAVLLDLHGAAVGADLPRAVPDPGHRRPRSRRERLPARVRRRDDDRIVRRRAVR